MAAPPPTAAVAQTGRAKSLGVTLPEPFLQVAFLPLPVIPHLKLTDKGITVIPVHHGSAPRFKVPEAHAANALQKLGLTNTSAATFIARAPSCARTINSIVWSTTGPSWVR